MEKKREKKRLTSKQTVKLAAIVSLIIFILISGFILLSEAGNYNIETLLKCILCMAMACMVYMVLTVLFKTYEKESEEIAKEIEKDVSQVLSKNEYKEVEFIDKGYDNDVDQMLIQIIKNEGCVFLAKLSDNNTINLVVKDKRGEEVYSAEIVNMHYFEANFKYKD